MSKEIINKVIDMYYKNYFTHEIAKATNLTEYEVIEILRKSNHIKA